MTEYDHFYFARPIAADEVNWPNADYRYGGTFFDDVVHTGVDIPAPIGTPVLAAGPGKVVWAGFGLYSGAYNADDPYGQAVVIRHDFGYRGETLYTVYGHLSQIDVENGQHIETGHQVGLVGITGFTTGPHLHFEVRVGTNRFLTTRNPELWLAPPQGWGILVGRVLNSSGRYAHRQLVYIQNLATEQIWTVRSYSREAINSDPFYQENLVIGDLPAGVYEIQIPFAGVLYVQEIVIQPGLVNNFTFRGRLGFQLDPSPTPTLDFTNTFTEE
jgi:murein DD-endopeptidase MepM/ murein hydrolase activator NlpD